MSAASASFRFVTPGMLANFRSRNNCTFWAKTRRISGGGSWLLESRFTGSEAIRQFNPNWDCASPKQGLPLAAMNDSIYQYVLLELQLAKGQWPRVARDTGISLSTIKKIARRDVEDPGVSYIERLARYFRDGIAA